MSEQSKDAPRIKKLMDYVNEDPEGFARAESELAQSEDALKQRAAEEAMDPDRLDRYMW